MHIADYPTKKAFREAVESPTTIGFVYLSDPAVIGACSGYIEEVVDKLSHVTVTNHPKRSWYANIERNLETGKLTIK